MPGVRVRPTGETRRTVRAMAGYGVPHAQIATFIRIDPKSLRKHYRDELNRGMIEANVKVAQTLFTLATADKNVAAAIFWMKARAGWRERPELESIGIVTNRAIGFKPLVNQDGGCRRKAGNGSAPATWALHWPRT